jgi:hypothetical protein
MHEVKGEEVQAGSVLYSLPLYIPIVSLTDLAELKNIPCHCSHALNCPSIRYVNSQFFENGFSQAKQIFRFSDKGSYRAELRLVKGATPE